MKAFIIPAIALSLLWAAPPAFAAAHSNAASQQDQQHKHKVAKPRGHVRPSNLRGQNFVKQKHVTTGQFNAAGRHRSGPGNTGLSRQPNGNRNFGNRNVRNNRNVRDNRDFRRRGVAPNFAFRNYGHHRNFNFNVTIYRRDFRSGRRYHWQYYRRPQHWYYRRWTYGEFLPRTWFARDYWISDYNMFGLVAPPDGCVWVRVGDDALLIDEDTGEVVQVVHRVFY